MLRGSTETEQTIKQVFVRFFIQSSHKALKSVMGLLSMFRTSYVLNRCVLNVKLWMMLMSIV